MIPNDTGPAILNVRTGSLISFETVCTEFQPEKANDALITAEANFSTLVLDLISKIYSIQLRV